jgi:hypothetical protein
MKIPQIAPRRPINPSFEHDRSYKRWAYAVAYEIKPAPEHGLFPFFGSSRIPGLYLAICKHFTAATAPDRR